MLIVPFLIYCGLLLLALLSIVLAIVHRCGRLKKVRHFYLVGTVTIVTLALIAVVFEDTKYRSEHFPLTQPNTTWSTADGSITLAVYDGKPDSLPSDWYEYDMRMLVDGELSISAASRGTESNTIASGTWRMAGSDTLVLRDGDGRIVLEREDNCKTDRPGLEPGRFCVFSGGTLRRGTRYRFRRPGRAGALASAARRAGSRRTPGSPRRGVSFPAPSRRRL